jgi:hypothetical protein
VPLIRAARVNIAYHRLLTHRGLTCPKWLEHAFVVLAICCVEIRQRVGFQSTDAVTNSRTSIPIPISVILMAITNLPRSRKVETGNAYSLPRRLHKWASQNADQVRGRLD